MAYNNAYAQRKIQFSEFLWYNIKTTVPVGMQLVQNSVDMVELNAKDINCKFFRFDRSVTSDDMVANAMIDYAKDLGVDVKKAALESIVDDDFAGAQLIGRMPTGNNLIVCGLVGLDTLTSYGVVIEYLDSVKHEDAMKITDNMQIKK